MLALKYILMLAGLALFGSAAALMAYDVYLAAQLHVLLRQQVRRTASVGVARIPSRAPAVNAESAKIAEGAGASTRRAA
jgi:hypothetical protein